MSTATFHQPASCQAFGARGPQHPLLTLQFSESTRAQTCPDTVAVIASGTAGNPHQQTIGFAGATPVRLGTQASCRGWLGGDEHFEIASLCLRPDPGLDVDGQMSTCFLQATSVLAEADFLPTDIIRTWFYLDQIDTRYALFNRIRNAFFAQHDFTRLPASTGIGATNTDGAALAMGLLAMRPRHAEARITTIPSPLQCPAPEYRSSFSRAMRLSCPDYRRLLISGTASISPNGTSAHPGDTQRQIDLTLRVLEAILASEHMTWSQVDRAIGYAKHRAGMEPTAQALAARTKQAMVVQADICRSDLLMEIELDARAPC